LVLGLDGFLNLLPVDAIRWIGKHPVEGLVRELIVRECVALDDVVHVLALDEHIRLAGRVRLIVEFLGKRSFQEPFGVEHGRVLAAA
jgi:hypothetical protein